MTDINPSSGNAPGISDEPDLNELSLTVDHLRYCFWTISELLADLSLAEKHECDTRNAVVAISMMAEETAGLTASRLSALASNLPVSA